MKVRFQNELFQLVITDHAQERMKQRGIGEKEILEILQSGKIKEKNTKMKFWVYKKLKNRSDNLVCLSVSIESPFLIVITTLVNWRPE